MAKEKKKADLVIPTKRLNIKELVSSMKKEFGDDVGIKSVKEIRQIPRTPSGITALDIILGGGTPDGRIIEIYGPESSGKTTITLHMIAAAQALGKQCAYIDAEHAYDPVYAANLGIDTDNLFIGDAISGEKSLAMMEALVRSGAIDLIVVDSVAALVPQKELDGDFGDSNVGLHARLMSQAMRKLVGPAQAMNCTIIFINQIREKVGVMFGNPETTTGGRALKFYSSVRLEVRKKKTLTEGDDAYANHVAVKTVKNKTFPPFKTAEFDIIFGKGVDNVGSIVDLAVNFDIMTKGGGGIYTYGNTKVKGRAKMIEFLHSDEGSDTLQELESKIKETLSKDSASMMNLSAEEYAQTRAQLEGEEISDNILMQKSKEAGIDTEEEDLVEA